jgi:hypothetical protein
MVATRQMKLMLGGCEAASRGSASDQADGAGHIKRTLSAPFRRRSFNSRLGCCIVVLSCAKSVQIASSTTRGPLCEELL